MQDWMERALLTDPSEVVRELFKTEKGEPLVLASYQNDQLRELLTRLVHGEPGRFAFVQSRRSGKSELIAAFISLALLIVPGIKIANISYTQAQARIIFKRVKAHMVNDNPWTLSQVNVGQSMVNRKEFSKTEFHMINGAQFRIFSTGKGETEMTGESLLGFGADIIVIDEAAAIVDEVYRERILPMLTDSNAAKFLVLSSTPHRRNFMYKAWHDPDFVKFHVTCWDAVKAGRMNEYELKKAQSEMFDWEFSKWMLAEFPDSDPDQLIRDAWITKAQRPIPTGLTRTRSILGVDCARYGKDLTVLTHVDFYDGLVVVKKILSYSKISTTQSARVVEKYVQENTIDKIIVDDVGVGGGVVDNLRLYPDTRSKVVAFSAGETPFSVKELKRKLTKAEETHNSKYLNKKSFAYNKLAHYFEKGAIVIPSPKESKSAQRLADELVSIRTEVSSEKSKIVDEKEEGNSPDHADSLMMAVSDIGRNDLVVAFI